MYCFTNTTKLAPSSKLHTEKLENEKFPAAYSSDDYNNSTYIF